MNCCIACGKDADVLITRYSALGYEAEERVCEKCLCAAFPKLAEKIAEEREIERKYQERQRAMDAAYAHLRDSPTPQEYKRRKREMIDKGLIR